MLTTLLVLTIVICIVALAFEYINGFHDTANAIATVVSTGVLSLKAAIIGAAIFNFVGAFFGSAVASTIGKGLLVTSIVSPQVVLAALLGAIVWDLVTWYYGIPSSSSHALVGGLVGAGFATAGSAAIQLEGITKVIKALIISPMAGILIGFLLMILITWLCKDIKAVKANKIFRYLQMVSASFMAFSHGSNDATKTMGVITMTLVAGGFLTFTTSQFIIPLWVIVICAVAMAAGTAAGGLRIIKTMGHKIVDLKPVHGFAAETSAAAIILTASAMGVPVSTTHVISSSIMGVGASRSLGAVKWGTTTRMLIAWVLTIPASALVAYLVQLGLMLLI